MTTFRLIQFVVAPGVLLAAACTPTETVPTALFPGPEGFIGGVVQSG